MFLDEVAFKVTSGHGGSGCMSFHRESGMPKGGPDGGDGGTGGSVIFKVDRQLNTLFHLKFQRAYRAKNGMQGMGLKKSGCNGADLILKVPPGTVIRDADNNELIVDFANDIEEWTILEGGKGGRGNTHFKSSVNQSPRQFDDGRPSASLNLQLSLKLIADVGLLGLPNAGKSSFLSRISNAKPKVAAYPFTTLTPMLGVFPFDDYAQLVVADIPGIIEGASEGKGLGLQFLKHIERTRILLHLVEPDDNSGLSPVERVKIIRNELLVYSETLAAKPEILALSKSDLNPEADDIRRWEKELGQTFHIISTATNQGIYELMAVIRQTLDELTQLEKEQAEAAAKTTRTDPLNTVTDV